MLNTETLLKPVSISHPLVRDAYVKKEAKPNHVEQDVLVLEMVDDEHEGDTSSFDSYLLDLLIDLESLKHQVQENGTIFHRVDIMTPN
ncbi:MAG: hypothetical protein ACPG05_04055 [Bdellovibrionales bacterium]